MKNGLKNISFHPIVSSEAIHYTLNVYSVLPRTRNVLLVNHYLATKKMILFSKKIKKSTIKIPLKFLHYIAISPHSSSSQITHLNRVQTAGTPDHPTKKQRKSSIPAGSNENCDVDVSLQRSQLEVASEIQRSPRAGPRCLRSNIVE